MVLALAIAITLGLVLGPLLKHDGSKEPTGPNDPKEPIGPTTLNVLDYYEDEKVVTIGKFTEQSLSQEIAIGDNNKQNFSIDGANYYAYSYKVSNMANNLESIEIKAENSNSFKDVESWLVRGNYSSYYELAEALKDDSIEHAFSNGDSAEYTLALSKPAEKAEISYCFIVASQSDISNNFKLTTSLKVKDGETFEKDSALLSSVEMQTGFNSISMPMHIGNEMVSMQHSITLEDETHASVLKISVDNQSMNEDTLAIDIFCNCSNLIPVLLTEEQVTSILTGGLVGKEEISQLSGTDWASISIMAQLYGNDYYEPGKSCSYGIKYINEKITVEQHDYYLIILNLSSNEDAVNSNINLSIGNLSKYKTEVYTLSDDGTYYIFDGLFDKTITSYDVKARYGDKNLPVKEVSDYAFRGTTITNVTFPDSIQKMGREMFSELTIANFIVPKGVKVLEESTFGYVDFGTLVIPETVTKIEKIFDCDGRGLLLGLFSAPPSIENLIIKCKSSAFVGDLTDGVYDGVICQIESLTVYDSELPSFILSHDGYSERYDIGSLYVKSEYLADMKTKYAGTYIYDKLKAIEE